MSISKVDGTWFSRFYDKKGTKALDESIKHVSIEDGKF